MKNRFRRLLNFLVIFLLVLLFPLNTLAGVFGVGVYLSSEPDGDKSTIANMMSDLGISITRTTIDYNSNPDWTPYDTAIDLTRSKGIEDLILLTYYDGVSVDDWGNFVQNVASRYSGKIVGYEIFNEADNYMSGSDYASYLSKSYDEIKSHDNGAKVVVSGLTARSEAANFWQGIYNAGAWDKLDVLGLHPYRDTAPEVVAYNVGDFITSINIAANFINSHGGGKKVWLTEFGVRSSTVGDTNQANYIARSYIMSRAVPEVEKVMMYRFRDGDGWGMVNSDLSHKTLWDTYRNVIRELDYSGTAERIYVYDKSTIDSFDSVSGYKTDQSSNGSVSLSTSSGHTGSGMKFDYHFNSSDAYVVADKVTNISGEPAGLGIWAKGPNTSSVLKLRIQDRNDETFQFDLGKVTGDWQFFKFDFNNDVAKTSWGGDGHIDYPIRFDSIVYDSQGGSSSGTLYLDDLVSINGSADLYAYKLESKLAYWKSNGSANASACGQSLNFTEVPQVTSVSNCTSWDSGSSSNEPSETPQEDESTGAKVYLSKSLSSINTDKDSATADGNDAITFSVTLKTTDGDITSSSKLKAEVSGSDNTQGDLVKDGDSYKMTLKSTKAEEKTVKFSVGTWELGSKKVTFNPGAYSANNTQIIPNKWTALVGDEIQLDLKIRDAHNNELAGDKKPAEGWALINSEGNATVTQEPNHDNGWQAKIKSDTPGKIVLGANYNNAVLPTQTIIYYNPILIPIENITDDKIITIKKDDKLSITSKPNDNLAVKLDGMADATKVVVKISSNPTYFWLTKETTVNQYQGVIITPQEPGKHEILVYSENEKGEVVQFASGTLTISNNATGLVTKTTKIPTWKYIVGILGGIILLALAVTLMIPKSRVKFISFIKALIVKFRRVKSIDE